MSAGPLSLYIHIPWCSVRCGYCDFNTYVTDTSDVANTAPYIEAVRKEIALASATLKGGWVRTVYFGGGTPTLMSAVDMGRILATVRRSFDLDDSAEITTEANPETLSPQYLEDIRRVGVNRLSLGMQSAVPHVLTTLDRVHTPGRAMEAVGWARKADFDQVSLDLIYGTPGESLNDWEATLIAALAVKPDHVSAYSLIVEDGTPLARRMEAGLLPYPDDDSLADKYVLAERMLSNGGLTWYEVSNWSKPGRECKHNMNYWRSGDWWGIGAGAHSHLDGTRWWNYRRPATYISKLNEGKSPSQGSEMLTSEERHEEKLMLKIRLGEGLSIADLTDAEYVRAEDYVASGHLVLSGTRLVCTVAGRLIADKIVRDILMASPRVARREKPKDLPPIPPPPPGEPVVAELTPESTIRISEVPWAHG